MKVFVMIFFISGIFSDAMLFAQLTPKTIIRPTSPYTIGYYEYLPPNYDTEPGNLPVLIFLHGSGESGGGTSGELEVLKTWGPPSHINSGHDMCFTVDGKTECFIVITPQIYGDIISWRGVLPSIIDHILNGPDHYKADPDRIYLTGMSLGGYGSYAFAAYNRNYPNKLAAIAPVAGFLDVFPEGCKISERQIPVWAFHGLLDTVVPYDKGLTAFTSIRSCTNPEPTAEMIFTTYDDVYHDSWIRAYDPSHTYHNPNLYEWLLRQKRIPQPIVSVAEDQQRSVFSIHPNPAYNELYLSFDESLSTGSSVTILSLTGVLVLKADAGQEEIDVSALSAGVYIVHVKTPSGTVATERLIKMESGLRRQQ